MLEHHNKINHKRVLLSRHNSEMQLQLRNAVSKRNLRQDQLNLSNGHSLHNKQDLNSVHNLHSRRNNSKEHSLQQPSKEHNLRSKMRVRHNEQLINRLPIADRLPGMIRMHQAGIIAREIVINSKFKNDPDISMMSGFSTSIQISHL
jgi:hypothetical protein